MLSSVKTVKEIIPADRLCHIQLSDGLDWEKICPFLDMPIPKEEYPDRNEPEKFKALVENFLKSKLAVSVVRLSLVAVPTFGLAVFAGWRYSPSIWSGLKLNSWF